MAETNVMAAETCDKVIPQRNYQLDFLKFVFTLFVFICHSSAFVGENTRITFPPALGQISVHFFFVVSGMLMVNSIIKSDADISDPGKSAMVFVLKKFKGISLQYWTALFVYTAIYIYIYIYIANSAEPLKSVFIIILRIFPEAFLMTNSGVVIEYNAPTWYLSAMFIVMLPLAYLLYKFRDFFLYVFAPLSAALSLGFWCQINEFAFGDRRNELFGIVIGGLIRAFCGLCFGVVAWLIYNKLKQYGTKKSQVIMLTLIEALIWIIFFGAWFILKDSRAIYSVLFVLPIAIAISFSGKSYVYRLFHFKWMSFFSPISLAIYFNHWIARNAVIQFFPDCSYKMGLSLMAAFTAVSCLLYYIIMKLCRILWNKKLKKVFSNQEV